MAECQRTKHTHAAANGANHAAAHAARSQCNRLCSLSQRFTSPLQFCDNMVAICHSDKPLHVQW